MSRIIKTPVYKILGHVLWIIVAVHFLTYYGHYNYTSITRDEVVTLLYKAVNPDLKAEWSKDCTYELLKSRRTLHNLDVLNAKFDNFSAVGILNGTYYPKHCRPSFSVAILVTYRNRQKQLDVFAPYMHDFLRKQNIHYKLYVIEQQDDSPFNKGLLYNIGARIAIEDKYPCLILHDVDLLPLDEANIYACMSAPRHMSASIDKFRFVLPYYQLVGGVLAIRSDQYVNVDGFSNQYLGWGGEDDDFANRLLRHQLHVLRLPREMATYTMLTHRQEPRNPARVALLAASDTEQAPRGYSAQYKHTLTKHHHRLFTLVNVRLHPDNN